MTTHIPQSLPSFAQAFSTPTLNSISSGSNSLPPIQIRTSPFENHRVNTPPAPSHSRPPSIESNGANLRKRTRSDIKSAVRDDDVSDTDRLSPRLIQIKEEHDHAMLEPPSPSSMQVDSLRDMTGAPPPSSLLPTPSKKRRVTISGTPHPLNTDVRIPPSDQANSTPISPVVIGLTIQRDDPAALEQVRSMLSVKQKQKALIEQRRGSVAGIVSTGTGAEGSTEERLPMHKSSVASRAVRCSPNPGSTARRGPNIHGQSGASTARPPSPGAMMVPSQQTTQVANQMTTSKGTLLPPPISFARRRAGQFGAGKKKPADIVISPRDAHTREQLQPAIQSAPPVLHAGQGQFPTGQFPMTLPRVPTIAGGESLRRSAMGQVPPTPSRFAMQRNTTNLTHVSQPSAPSFPARSPPASVAIATSLVPPTPTSLHHPGYTGDKSAFLAPFGVFYDALNDSKQLKNWLGEQMHKSNLLMQTLTQQQEKMDELVDSLVERKVHGMRDEISALHRRVEELEDALRVARSEMITRRQSGDMLGGGGPRTQGKQTLRNGIMPVAPEPYTFPPVLERRRGDPTRKQSPEALRLERDQSLPASENGSPAPYSTRRLSISATRLDPPRVQVAESSSQQPHGSFTMQSSSQTFREGPPRHGQPALSSPRGKSGSVSLNSTPVLAVRSTHAPSEAPALLRQQTNPRLPMSPSADRTGSPMDDD